MGLTWLDLKLALRMLVRYPGLTIVGVVGMAAGIAIAAGAFGILYRFTDPALPLDEGDRIVAILQWDAATNRRETRILGDFMAWRGELKSIEALGAHRQVTRNLIAPGSQPEAVRVAEMTASGFTVARVPALMGRHLLISDEDPTAQPVVVIGFDAWRGRFRKDPEILGRSIQLGDVHYTVVGVMPEGFEFPISHHYWVPLRAGAVAVEPRNGPSIAMFARLAPTATLEIAQAELTTIGERTAAALPASHARLRPRVLPYTYPFFGLEDADSGRAVHLIQFLVSLLLVIVCINVSILVYARTATRQGEIAVRTALGASRRRIVGQLFVEALALAVLSALIGLLITSVALKQVQSAMAVVYPQLPFWWNFRLTPGAILYVTGLTVLGASIIGVIPALKATGRRVHSRLLNISAGGGSGMLLGRTWTLLIVAQVAFSVALLPGAIFQAWDSVRLGSADPGFAADEFLTTQLVLDAGASPADRTANTQETASRYAARHDELLRRLEAEAAITEVTFTSNVPGEEATAWVEVEGISAPSGGEAEAGSGFVVHEGTAAGYEIRFNRVDVRLFDVLDVPVLAGRSFDSRDADAAAGSVVVNRAFVEHVLGHGNALGRRLRYVGASGDAIASQVQLGRWYEIVGVVSNFPAQPMAAGLADAKVYHAGSARDLYPVVLAMRVRGSAPLEFAGRLREIAAEIDPNLQLRDIGSMEDVMRREQAMLWIVAAVLTGLTAAVVLLSAAGVYAMMSFTVAQRRREIGIRAALGADPRRILQSLFSRAASQLAAGAILGLGAAALLERLSDGDLLNGHGAVILPLVALFMMGIGFLAALGPAHRAFRVHPTDVLREQ